MRNIRTNKKGLAAANLWFNNEWVMTKYYFRNRKTVEYPIRWRSRIWRLIQALLVGWEFHNLRTEKQWVRTVQRRGKS